MSFACSSPAGGMLFGVSGLLLLLLFWWCSHYCGAILIIVAQLVGAFYLFIVIITPLPPPMRLRNGLVLEFATAFKYLGSFVQNDARLVNSSSFYFAFVSF